MYGKRQKGESMNSQGERFVREVGEYLTEGQKADLHALSDQLEAQGAWMWEAVATLAGRAVMYALMNAGIQPSVEVRK